MGKALRTSFDIHTLNILSILHTVYLYTFPGEDFAFLHKWSSCFIFKTYVAHIFKSFSFSVLLKFLFYIYVSWLCFFTSTFLIFFVYCYTTIYQIKVLVCENLSINLILIPTSISITTGRCAWWMFVNTHYAIIILGYWKGTGQDLTLYCHASWRSQHRAVSWQLHRGRCDPRATF